jgi:hypothetical protein
MIILQGTTTMNRLLATLALWISVMQVLYARPSDDQLARYHPASSATDSTACLSAVLRSGSDLSLVSNAIGVQRELPGPHFLEPIVPGEIVPLVPFEQDSTPQAPKPRLLPDNLSFFERAMWGESGIMRSVGIASPLTPDVRKHELSVRRTMLTAHQIGGFVTLGLMATTVYFGQRYLDHGQRNDLDMHQTFVAATIASYAATGLLAIFSPPPLIRRDEFSTTTLHKTLAWIHVAGMIITPILGAAISRRGSSYYDQAHFHQVSAYITTAVFAASMIIITF